MADIPIVITPAGAQPFSPAAINARIIEAVALVRPGYTANLPGSLIEDISSTETAGVVECDSARVETINSLTPYGANAFLLYQLGQQFGVPIGLGSNTSVLLRFSGTPGFVIGKGFIVSDGSFQYVVTDGGIVGADGNSALLFALATQTGTWAVPAGTVTQFVTSVPDPITLTVVNPEAGIPGTGQETMESYRSRVLQAQLAASQGMLRFLRTLLGLVSGVQQRLVTAKQRDDGKWMVICGGGDPYQVAYAIYTALFDINNLVGSALLIAGITNANPGVVTTFLNHGLSVGDAINIADSDPNDYDGDFVVQAVPTEKTFALGKLYSQINVITASWATGTATVETDGAHGITVGTTVAIAGINPTGYNGSLVVTGVPNPDEIEYALVADPGSYISGGFIANGIALFNTTSLTPWSDGGLITPNPRNIEVTITDYPDSYVVTYVNPPPQTVTMTVTWNTSSPNFVSQAAIAQLAAPALAAYVETVVVGQPMNLDTMAEVFRAAVASVLRPELITRLVFAVAINGIGTPAEAGTVIINGDPESYFTCAAASVSVGQG